jgi:hypothetical protein
MGDYSNEQRGTLILYLPIKSKSCTMQCLLQAKQSILCTSQSQFITPNQHKLDGDALKTQNGVF